MDKYVRTNKNRIGIFDETLNKYVFMKGTLPLDEWWEDGQEYFNNKIDVIKIGDIVKFNNKILGEGFGEVINISKKTNSIKIRGDLIVPVDDIIGLISANDINVMLEVI